MLRRPRTRRGWACLLAGPPIIALLPVTALGVVATWGTVRIAPPPEPPADPVDVFVADYGDTSKLFLPAASEDGGPCTGWGFGDWTVYALDRTGIGDKAAAVLVPTPGTLVRVERPSPPPDGPLAGWIDDPELERVYRITVSRARAHALASRLEAAWGAHAGAEIDDRRRRLRFVPSDDRYWIFRQSTSTMKGWLGELGCICTGWSFRANFAAAPGVATESPRGHAG